MEGDDRVRDAYDALGDAYRDHRSPGGPATAVLRDVIEAVETPARFLDAGCGPGTPALAHLADRGDAVGLDVSRAQLNLARSAAPTAAHVQGSMATLPFGDATFDAVVALWSLIHVPLADHPAAIEEFARVLRPGGRLLLCEGAGEEWIGSNPDWLETGVEMHWAIAGATATRSHLRDAGCTVRTEYGIPETLEDDGDGSDETAEGEPGLVEGAERVAEADVAWTLFEARLED